MKAIVRIQFYDTKEKKQRKVGDIMDVTAERFNEIIKKGRYIEAVDEKKPVKA